MSVTRISVAVRKLVHDRASNVCEYCQMPSEYDEFTERASPDYAGGTDGERQNRDKLRQLMEANGFTVNPDEWWHFDLKTWRDYAIYDIAFSEIGKKK